MSVPLQFDDDRLLGYVRAHFLQSNRNLFLYSLLGVTLGAVSLWTHLQKNGPTEGGVVIFGSLITISLWKLLSSVRRSKRPALSPSVAKLRKYGSLSQVCSEIEQDLAQAHERFGGDIRITRNWLLNPRSLGFDIINLSEIVWAYERITQSGPLMGENHTVVRTADGTDLQIPRSRKGTSRLLSALSANAPWIVFGFDEKLAKVWNTDRESLNQLVQKRKHELEPE